MLVEASVLEVEVFGLGGRTAREIQNSFKKREQLFTDQRRKVTKSLQYLTRLLLNYIIWALMSNLHLFPLQIDLKTFSNWEDSPEKMMMDMMSNPNAARREER